MTLTPDEWAKLESSLKGKYRVLESRDEIRSQIDLIQHPQDVLTVTFEPDRLMLREIDFSHRRRGNWRIIDEEWSIRVGGLRDLEDLILECVDAGINIEDYL